MLDSIIRPHIDPPLNWVGRVMVKVGLSADVLTGIGFVFALGAFAALAGQLYWLAGVLLLVNRFFDGIDGPTARQSGAGATDLGGFLDIVTDFIFYAGFVFFFAVGQPEIALAAAFLIFSFMGTSSTFLAYAIMAERRGLKTESQGKKSFFYLSSLTEGTETILALLLICLLPGYFDLVAIIFGILCWITTVSRVLRAIRELR